MALSDELLHFSSKPLLAVEDAQQGSANPGYRTDKPVGLWVSVGHAWLDWCVAESFRLSSWQHVTRIVLANDASVLRLGSVADLDVFHDEYYVETGRYTGLIDWARLAQRFDGIIIAPYQWARRLEGDVGKWYYTWDVASGCIWNARAVAALESVRVIPETLLVQEHA